MKNKLKEEIEVILEDFLVRDSYRLGPEKSIDKLLRLFLEYLSGMEKELENASKYYYFSRDSEVETEAVPMYQVEHIFKKLKAELKKLME